MQNIYFYRTQDPFGEFSNFSRHPIKLKEKTWPTTEHYFQAMKYEGTKREEEIRNAGTPMQAAKMGRDRSIPMREDWERVKEDIMKEALIAKFTQYPKLTELILSTGDAPLFEASKIDSYWGTGQDGKGQNRLGVLLMKVREELK
jgi:ribA/ribD-fused uncharacterized protein